MKKTNAFALIPIGVFVVFYLSLGIIFEYVIKISMGFYNVPVVVAFLVALFVAILQTKGISLDKKLGSSTVLIDSSVFGKVMISFPLSR